jgi:hypothetical protein
MVILIALSIPSVRALSMELFQKFVVAASDIIGIEFTSVDPSAFEPLDDAEVKTRSIEEASSRSGFTVKSPDTLPEGYSLDYILAIDGSPQVMLVYKAATLGRSIRITEMPLDLPEGTVRVTSCIAGIVQAEFTGSIDEQGNMVGESETVAAAESDNCGDLASVGRSAEIVSVSLNGAIGEYVRGDWVIDEDQQDLAETEPGESIDYTFVWDSEFPKHSLKWEADGLKFELTAYDRDLTFEEIVAIAESMN